MWYNKDNTYKLVSKAPLCSGVFFNPYPHKDIPTNWYITEWVQFPVTTASATCQWHPGRPCKESHLTFVQTMHS